MRFVEYHPSHEHPEPSVSVKPGDYIGRSIKDVFPRPAVQELEKTIKVCLKTKKSQQTDYPWEMLGATLWFNARITPLLNEGGETTGVAVVVRDITDRIKTEKALEESEKKYRKIFENSPQGFILLDTEGHIIDVNKKICDWLGYRPEEILGKDHILYPFLTKQGKITAMQKFVQRMSGKTVPAYELEFITKSGETFLGEVLAMQIRDDEGKIVQILAMITDISDHLKE
jgi:PAS domain S-box-containing protein